MGHLDHILLADTDSRMDKLKWEQPQYHGMEHTDRHMLVDKGNRL